MQLENPFPWRYTDISKWKRAFSIPTLTWAKPFIPLLGLPQAMRDNPEVWSEIYHVAIADYQHRLDIKDWEISNPRGYSNLVEQVFSKAFQKLAEQMGEQTAINFEKWILLYIFCKDFRLAMKSWSNLLHYTCHPNKKYEIFPLPKAFELLLSDIAPTLSREYEKQIEKSIYDVAPAPAEEQIPYEKLDYVYEALVIEKIIRKALTMEVLHLISSRLTQPDRKEFIEWAEAQSLLWYRISYPDHLQPDLYLVNEMPTTDLPLKLSKNILS